MAVVLDRSFRRSLCASLLLWVALAVAPAAASAGVRFNVQTMAPANVTVGQTAVPMGIGIANTSFNRPGEAGYDADSMQLDTIIFVPSCGSDAIGANCPPGLVEPGVIVPSPLTGIGRGACATHTFSFALIDAAQGRYAVTTNTPPLTLAASTAPLAQRRCVIEFTASVVRMPTFDSDLALAGMQTDQKAGAAGTDIGPNNATQTGSDAGSGRTTVSRATPTIATTASAAISLGAGSLTDTATVSGLVSPVAGATVEFQLFGPDDATCATAIFTSSSRPLELSGTTGTATSQAFTPTAAGTYRWRAFYSGDANNAAVSGACNDPNENVAVSTSATSSSGSSSSGSSSSGTPPAVTPTSGTTPSGVPTCGGRKATIAVAVGQSTINGTPGADVIVGRDAAETINGGGGDDLICAGKGNDTVRGGAGNDGIGGEAGRDKLFGNGGNDLVLGGSGNDDLRGGAGNDRIGGGSGQDRVDGGAGNDLLDEQKLGGAGNDRLFGSLGKDNIRTAGGGADRIDCGSGPSRDSVRMDRLDRQQRCELVRRVAT